MSRPSQELDDLSKLDSLIFEVSKLARLADFCAQMHDENLGVREFADNSAECLKTAVYHLRDEVEKLAEHWSEMDHVQVRPASGEVA